MALKNPFKNVWRDDDSQKETNAFAKAGAVVETRRPQELRVATLWDWMEGQKEKPPKYAEGLGQTIALPFGAAGTNKMFHKKTVAFQKLSAQLRWLKSDACKGLEAEELECDKPNGKDGKAEDEKKKSSGPPQENFAMLENAFAPYAMMYVADSFTKPPHVDADDVIVLHTPPMLAPASSTLPSGSGPNLNPQPKNLEG